MRGGLARVPRLRARGRGPRCAWAGTLLVLGACVGLVPGRGLAGELEEGRDLLGRGESLEAAARLVALARARPEAEVLYWAGRALDAAGQRSSALERYLGAVLASGQRPNAGAARELARDVSFPLDAGRCASLARLDLRALEPRVQQRLAHRVALHLLRLGDDGRARGFLARARGAAARYLEALIELRRGALGPGRARLEAARRAAAEAGEAGVAELSALALARVELEQGNLARAEDLYGEVPVGSPYFFRAQQERAWLLLRAGRPEQALGVCAALRAPRLAKYHFPDRELILAVAWMDLCRPGPAAAAARRARSGLEAQSKNLSRFLRPRPDARLYYVEATASAAQGSGGLSAELVAALLADPGFRRVFRVVRQVQRERRLLLDPRAGALRGELSAELDQRLVQAQERAGREVQQVLGRVGAELRELRGRAEELLFDLEGPARARQGMVGSSTRGRKVRWWPFRSEYWSDELGHLVWPGRSSCAGAR